MLDAYSFMMRNINKYIIPEERDEKVKGKRRKRLEAQNQIELTAGKWSEPKRVLYTEGE